MANPYGYTHDASNDRMIAHMIKGDTYGSWNTVKGKKTYTPKMSFFRHVRPHQLATYFVEHHADDLRLNLP